jgi:hypothetical protein
MKLTKKIQPSAERLEVILNGVSWIGVLPRACDAIFGSSVTTYIRDARTISPGLLPVRMQSLATENGGALFIPAVFARSALLI